MRIHPQHVGRVWTQHKRDSRLTFAHPTRRPEVPTMSEKRSCSENTATPNKLPKGFKTSVKVQSIMEQFLPASTPTDKPLSAIDQMEFLSSRMYTGDIHDKVHDAKGNSRSAYASFCDEKDITLGDCNGTGEMNFSCRQVFNWLTTAQIFPRLCINTAQMKERGTSIKVSLTNSHLDSEALSKIDGGGQDNLFLSHGYIDCRQLSVSCVSGGPLVQMFDIQGRTRDSQGFTVQNGQGLITFGQDNHIGIPAILGKESHEVTAFEVYEVLNYMLESEYSYLARKFHLTPEKCDHLIRRGVYEGATQRKMRVNVNGDDAKWFRSVLMFPKDQEKSLKIVQRVDATLEDWIENCPAGCEHIATIGLQPVWLNVPYKKFSLTPHLMSTAVNPTTAFGFQRQETAIIASANNLPDDFEIC